MRNLASTLKKADKLMITLANTAENLKKQYSFQDNLLDEPNEHIKASEPNNWYLYIQNFPSELSLSHLTTHIQQKGIIILEITQKIKTNLSEVFLKLWTNCDKINELIYKKQTLQNQDIRFFFAKKPSWIRNNRKKFTSRRKSNPGACIEKTTEQPTILPNEITDFESYGKNVSKIKHMENIQNSDSVKPTLSDELLKTMFALNWKSYLLIKTQSKSINKNIEKMEKYFIKKQTKSNIKAVNHSKTDPKMLIESENQESQGEKSLIKKGHYIDSKFLEDLTSKIPIQSLITLRATNINFQAPSSINLDLDSRPPNKARNLKNERNISDKISNICESHTTTPKLTLNDIEKQIDSKLNFKEQKNKTEMEEETNSSTPKFPKIGKDSIEQSMTKNEPNQLKHTVNDNLTKYKLGEKDKPSLTSIKKHNSQKEDQPKPQKEIYSPQPLSNTITEELNEITLDYYYPEFKIKSIEYFYTFLDNRRQKFIQEKRLKLQWMNNLSYTSLNDEFTPRPLLQHKNSCFLNAILHMLFGMTEFIKPILASTPTPNSLTKILKEIYYLYSHTNLLTLYTDRYETLYAQVLDKVSLKLGLQHDAEELWTRMLDILSRELPKDQADSTQPIKSIELIDSQEVICANCNASNKHSQKAWSLRLDITSQSLLQELNRKFTGIHTDSTAFCDLCICQTQRLIKTEKLQTNTFIILVLNKNDIQKIGGKLTIPLNIETNTPPIHIENQIRPQLKESYSLLAIINHHGHQHTSGHYTYSHFDISKGLITTLDGPKVSKAPLVITDNSDSYTSEDPYIVIYKHKESPFKPKHLQNTQTIKAYDDNTQTKPKRGRPPQKKTPKPDPSQKSLLQFYKTKEKESSGENTQNLNKVDQTDALSVLYSNIRSVRANKIHLETYVERHQPKIIALTETWQKQDYPPLKLKQDYYSIIEKRRDNKDGGGLALFIDKYLQAYEYSPINTEHALAVKILSNLGHKGGHFFIILFYAPPKMKPAALKDLSSILDYLKKRYNDPAILIIGDFNLLEEDPKIQEIKKDFGLSGCISTDNTASAPTTQRRRIDYPLYANTTIKNYVILKPIGKSDHKTLLFEINWKHTLIRKTLMQMSRTFLISKLKEVDLTGFDGLKDYLSLSKWLQICNKPIQINKRNYFTQSEKLMIKLLNHESHQNELARALAKISNSNFRNALNNLIYPSSEISLKSYHQTLKALMRITPSAPLVEGLTDGEEKVITDQASVHEQLLKFFKDKYNDKGKKTKFPNTYAPNIKLESEEYDTIISKISQVKGNGFDYVPLALLSQEGGKKFMKSVVEDILKETESNSRIFATRLVLLSKSFTKYPKITEIRPIAVTTLPQKIIEHILLNRLEKDLAKTINRAQYGFRPQKETLMHLIRLIDRLRTHKSQKLPRLQQFLVFIDFSSAFDCIDHNLLLDKITKTGKCSQETDNLLKWYLSQITINLNHSTIFQNNGSPQGGIASPFLWLYINDLLDELECITGIKNLFAFADDLMVYCRSLPMTRNIIRLILKWSEANKIKVNAKKSSIMSLAKSKRKSDIFNKSIQNIPYVKSYKYLGIIFDYTMKFGSTLDKVSKTIRSMKNYYSPWRSKHNCF